MVGWGSGQLTGVGEYGWLTVAFAPIGGAVGWVVGRRRYKAGTLSQEIENLGSWSAVYDRLLANFATQQAVIDQLSERATEAEQRAIAAEERVSEAMTTAHRASFDAAQCETNRASDEARHKLEMAGLSRQIAERDERLAALDLRLTELSGKLDRRQGAS